MAPKMTIALRLEAEQKARLDQRAKEMRMQTGDMTTVSDIIRAAIDQHLADTPEQAIDALLKVFTLDELEEVLRNKRG